MMATDKAGKIEQACSTAEEFSKLYFNTLDKCRHKLSKLYMDDASLVWNGNRVTGNEAIAMFYKNLPISETTLHSLDSQPILDEVVQGQTTILVVIAGVIKFQEKPAIPFQQHFMLTVQSGVWKVVTDCFRFQETI